MSGSSPWMFTRMSSSAKSPAAQAMRSVPLGRSLGVITALPPCAATASAMRTSSVATITSSRDFAFLTASTTQATRGFPQRSASGFPGKRLDPYRDGMMPKIFMYPFYHIP